MSALCSGLRKLLFVAFDLKEGEDMARTGDALKDTPLHQAARHNPNVDVVARLIDLGAEVNARNADRWQPLHMAAQGNRNPAKLPPRAWCIFAPPLGVGPWGRTVGLK